MRISLNMTNYSWPGDPGQIGSQIGRVVRAADEAGVDTAWVADHLLQADPNASPDAEMLDAFSVLAFLASQTARIRLGTMVAAATFREPALLIKSVTTLDVLSNGRAWLGIGAGYHQGEAAAMGLFLPGVAERFERLEEILQLALHMWSGRDTTPFEGRHYRLERPVTNPKPIRRPHPPILIGGAGEQKTLRLVAKYGDACNLFDIPDGGRTIKHKLSVLAAHCAEAGRSFGEIEKTVSTRLQPGEAAASFAERCAAIAALGIDHVVVLAPGPWTEDGIATLAEAIPQLRDVPAATAS